MKINEVMAKLNEEQKEVLNQFTRINSKRSHMEQNLGVLVNSEGKWVYNGYIDTGKFGNGRCSNGHALRYVHQAINETTGERIDFGIKCVTEFFQMSENVRRLIEKNMIKVNELLKSIYELVDLNSDNYNVYQKKIEYIGNVNGIRNIDMIKKMIEVKLPIPFEFAYDLDKKYEAKVRAKGFEEKKEQFLNQHPEVRSAITMFELIKDTINNSRDYEILNSLIIGFNRYGNLTEKQIALLIKLISKDEEKKDFSEVKEKLEKLTKVRLSSYDIGIVRSLINQFEVKEWLSEKQIALVDKLIKRYRKQIKEIEC